MVPQASVYPAAMRATRDLLRRRCPLVRQRAELLAHLHNTTSQYTLPEIGKKLADKAHRAGVEEHFPAPRVRQTLAVAVSLSDPYDQWRGEGELSITRSAKAHDVQTFSRLHLTACRWIGELHLDAQKPHGRMKVRDKDEAINTTNPRHLAQRALEITDVLQHQTAGNPIKRLRYERQSRR